MIDFGVVKQSFDKWIMKDYVKSVKGFDFPISFDKTMTNEELKDYVNKFIQLRDDLYTGGICLKEYVKLHWGNITHEFRAFYFGNVPNLRLLYHNSNNDNDTLPYDFARQTPKLESNFYTIDFALLENGKLIVIETGDGQVSGIDNEKAMEKFYEEIGKV